MLEVFGVLQGLELLINKVHFSFDPGPEVLHFLGLVAVMRPALLPRPEHLMDIDERSRREVQVWALPRAACLRVSRLVYRNRDVLFEVLQLSGAQRRRSRALKQRRRDSDGLARLALRRGLLRLATGVFLRGSRTSVVRALA